MNYDKDDWFELVNLDYNTQFNGDIVTVVGTVDEGEYCGCGKSFYEREGALIAQRLIKQPCDCPTLVAWTNLRKIDKSQFKEVDKQINIAIKPELVQ